MRHAFDNLKRKYEAVRREWEEDSRKRRRLRKRFPIDHQDRTARHQGRIQQHIDRVAAAWISNEFPNSVRILRRQLTAECTISIVCPPAEEEQLPIRSAVGLKSPAGECGEEKRSSRDLLAEYLEEEQKESDPVSEGYAPAKQQPDEDAQAPQALDLEHEEDEANASAPLSLTPSTEQEPAPASPTTRRTSASSSLTLQPQPQSHPQPHTSSTTTDQFLQPQHPQQLSRNQPTPAESSPPSPSAPQHLASTLNVESWLHALEAAPSGGEWAKLPPQRPYETDQWHAEALSVGESATVMAWRRQSGAESSAD